MAIRCPRCRANDLERETYGVFRCATCGRVNVDGESIPDGETEAPGVVRTSAASFAAPPRGTTPVRAPRPPLPRLLFAFIVIEAALSTWAMFQFGGSVFRLLIRYSVFGGLLTGHRGAYRYAAVGMMASLVFSGIAVMALWPQVNTVAHALLVLLLGIDLVFFASLLSDDARKHFEG